MVGNDIINRTVEESLPEELAVRCGADRGTALEVRLTVGDALGLKADVVVACLMEE